MTGKNQDAEFRHLDTVAYLQSLTKEEAAKQPPLVRESGGIITQCGRGGSEVRCREVAADELSGPGASGTEALFAAAKAEFGRLLPKLKAELAGGGVPDPVPSRHRSARDCSVAARRPMRSCSRRSTPRFRPRAAGHAEGGRNSTAGSRRRFIRVNAKVVSGSKPLFFEVIVISGVFPERAKSCRRLIPAPDAGISAFAAVFRGFGAGSAVGRLAACGFPGNAPLRRPVFVVPASSAHARGCAEAARSCGCSVRGWTGRPPARIRPGHAAGPGPARGAPGC